MDIVENIAGMAGVTHCIGIDSVTYSGRDSDKVGALTWVIRSKSWQQYKPVTCRNFVKVKRANGRRSLLSHESVTKPPPRNCLETIFIGRSTTRKKSFNIASISDNVPVGCILLYTLTTMKTFGNNVKNCRCWLNMVKDMIKERHKNIDNCVDNR